MLAISNLVDRSVDYAGLFPPAALGLEAVVANYDRYFNSSQNSMLGRLIIPANKLADFELQFARIVSEQNAASGLDRGWRISALVPPIDESTPEPNTEKFDLAIEAIIAFNLRSDSTPNDHPKVDSIEVKTSSAATTRAIIQAVPDGIDAFLEIDWRTDPSPLVRGIAENRSDKRAFAKIRTGGVTADLIPSSDQVAQFIAACTDQRVGFKATAGLHHPMRSDYRLTYQPDAPVATLHGFINVFLATVVSLAHNISQDSIVEILNNTHPDKFHFDDKGLRWRDLSVSNERIREFRQSGILSFGSCSFTEPTEELLQLPGATLASVFPG